MVYDRERKLLVMFDGFSTYTSVDRVWTRLVADPSPPPRTTTGMAFSSTRRRVVMIGGIADSVFLDDGWELGELGWSPIEQISERPPARAPVPLSPYGSSLLLFGGPSPFGELGDTWQFQYGASTRDDEICDDDIDNDGDRHVDIADPDCVY